MCMLLMLLVAFAAIFVVISVLQGEDAFAIMDAVILAALILMLLKYVTKILQRRKEVARSSHPSIPKPAA